MICTIQRHNTTRDSRKPVLLRSTVGMRATSNKQANTLHSFHTDHLLTKETTDNEQTSGGASSNKVARAGESRLRPGSGTKSNKKPQHGDAETAASRLVVPRMTADVGGDGREWRRKNFFLTPHAVVDWLFDETYGYATTATVNRFDFVDERHAMTDVSFFRRSLCLSATFKTSCQWLTGFIFDIIIHHDRLANECEKSRQHCHSGEKKFATDSPTDAIHATTPNASFE